MTYGTVCVACGKTGITPTNIGTCGECHTSYIQRRCDDLVHRDVHLNVTSAINFRLGKAGPEGYLDELLIVLDETGEPMEVNQYLAVGNQLAEALRVEGETVEEVFGWNVWARTTGGQAVSMDAPIEAIAYGQLVKAQQDRKRYSKKG